MDSLDKDHDILIELAKDVCWVKKILGNHLKHHWIITLAACSAATGAITSLVILLLRGN